MILAIESSCDDSSISITKIDSLKLVFHKKISQEIEHSIYGGVVPELAARLHIEALPKILEECKEYLKDLKAVAVTNAPGCDVIRHRRLACIQPPARTRHRHESNRSHSPPAQALVATRDSSAGPLTRFV